MTQLILLTKASVTNQLKQIDTVLKRTLEGLDAEAEITGVATNKWAQISLSGGDEVIATNLIRKEIGFCPISIENVSRFTNLKGYITKLGRSTEAIYVDIGILQPKTAYAMVYLQHLQAVLVDGRELALKKIVELFGFCEDLPINVKVTAMGKADNAIEAELAAREMKKFTSWQESLLDRLIVIGSSLRDVVKTLRYNGLDRDIIGIESFGMFEHALTCKLGTDAAGLISQIGRRFREARLAVFSPRKIMEFLRSPTS